MKRVLAIRTADRDFGDQLAKNFNKDQDFLFQTYVFSESEAFIDFAESNSINVLLCDEELLNGGSEPRTAELVIAFSELSTAGEPTAAPSIFKYQASGKIMDEILMYYSKFLPSGMSENTPKLLTKKICCVSSPVGGAFSSTFALALADSYSSDGRSLFISFDPFFTLPETEKDPKERNLSDLLSYIDTFLEQKNVTEQDHMKNMEMVREYIEFCTIKRGNLELLNGAAHWFDICDMDAKHTHYLLESICGNGYYRYVVFDTGVFGASCMEIFLLSGTILVPYTDSPLGIRKLNEWKRQIRFSRDPSILEKTRELIIPQDEGLKGEYGYESLLKGTLGRYILANGF